MDTTATWRAQDDGNYPYQQTSSPAPSGAWLPPSAPSNAVAAAIGGDDPFANACLSVCQLVNNVVVAHPLTVLRRQCQVHQLARKQHLTPFTLVPVVIKIIGKDGIWTLWKGVLGTGVLWTLSRLTEFIIADLAGWPRHHVPNGSVEKFWRHCYLKTATFLATTPFAVTSFVETVRSSTGLGLDDTKVFDVLVRGFERLRLDAFGARDGGRRFSVFYLAAPTVLFGTSRFLLTTWLHDIVFNMARRYVSRKPPSERTRFHAIMPDLFASITSIALADIVCYPAETILHRLYIQGTRTLIDNLDTGASAISVAYRYTGFLDCFQTIIKKEGVLALYSGIGAIGVQYALQYLVLRTVRLIFDHASSFANAPLVPAPTYHPASNAINGAYAGSAPSTHFAPAPLRVEPAADGDVGASHRHTPPSAFPTFAQTSATADFSWQTYDKNSNAPNIFDR